MVVVPHHVEHNRNALVYCLLVQPLFTARSEQPEEVITVKPVDQVFCDVTRSPRQARFIGSVRIVNFRSLNRIKVQLDSIFDWDARRVRCPIRRLVSIISNRTIRHPGGFSPCV